MSSHAWMCRLSVVLGALTLAIVPVCRPSREQMERSAALTGQSASAPQQTIPPLAQLSTAEKTAAKALQVTYEAGQLTIAAENSPLSEVLKSLRTILGMEIDLPPSVAEQRVWLHLGPGPARRVLRELLDGTEFDYVIQASENDEDGIRSVLLTPRSKSAAPVGNPAMPERAANRAPESENAANRESIAPAAAAPADASPPSANEQASSVSPQREANSSSGTSTPSEQMIQTLQSMYQQRRQIQIQSNQSQRPSASAPNQ